LYAIGAPEEIRTP